ncbi:hypothetical protein P153DRAFT_118389 [Dothidotthia symphoricarpi CBS 119687]|uniref:Fungal N-terminal domain-containing protein n=1 Tax=Dothidotthia symphoricarpi CBS 119687 TaxID=1392245 RepID=A0A6A6A375_9PLEO|nr:uncharacterized protein P153DRAFT_118389 [Dothidotthia symphoricarpi CBS 119687]KAF2125031.1 hypothetical protein P153DRAFT_118389 [Dothidotthia symphoricarpi CBS 119687]
MALDVAASIIGILAAAGKIAETLGPVISTFRDSTKHAAIIFSEIDNSRAILGALQTLFVDLDTTPRRRRALIHVDQLVAALTDGVLLFSELEALVVRLDHPAKKLMGRLQWAWNDKEFVTLVSRIQCFKTSISTMLNILQCESDAEAKRGQQELLAITSALLSSNLELSRRMAHLETCVDGGESTLAVPSAMIRPVTHDNVSMKSENTVKRVPKILFDSARVFQFENDLKTSRVYRNANRNTVDFSFRSSIAPSQARSGLSDVSLSDISAVVVIALPVSFGDVTNVQHYTFDHSVVGRANPHTSEQASRCDQDPQKRTSGLADSVALTSKGSRNPQVIDNRPNNKFRRRIKRTTDVNTNTKFSRTSTQYSDVQTKIIYENLCW